jgi:hypothetical protein
MWLLFSKGANKGSLKDKCDTIIQGLQKVPRQREGNIDFSPCLME